MGLSCILENALLRLLNDGTFIELFVFISHSCVFLLCCAVSSALSADIVKEKETYTTCFQCINTSTGLFCANQPTENNVKTKRSKCILTANLLIESRNEFRGYNYLYT